MSIEKSHLNWSIADVKPEELFDEPLTYPSSNFSSLEITNLILQILCYACLVSFSTTVIGASATVVRSVGGSNEIAPIPVGIYFLGSSVISLVTVPLFARGRKCGFLFGSFIGILGACMGGAAIWIKSPTLLLFAYLPLGMSFGIGNYLRFAAVEVVHPSKKSLAVTLVLTGGIISAFVGPEAAQATRTTFGEDLEYMGSFMMILIYNFLMVLLQLMIRYPVPRKLDFDSNEDSTPNLFSILLTREFILPAFISSLCWAIMALPMSIVRVAMTDLGFSSRESLLIIEGHFVGMYCPGFITGRIIDRKGEWFTYLLAILVFVIMSILTLVAITYDTTITSWMLGLFLAGVGWNFGFSAATLSLSKAYSKAPKLTKSVQAANDFIMFLLAGSIILSTGYVYEGGGGGIAGWSAVNYVALSLIAILNGAILYQGIHERTPKALNRHYVNLV